MIIVAHDQDWQFPAITEQHAFNQLRKSPFKNDEATYVAFPWATLIDYLDNNHSKKRALLEAAICLVKSAKPAKYRITVCQHIRASHYIDLFKRCGITDIFWSHAPLDTNEFAGIRIHPFALYPVNSVSQCKPMDQREYDFSFVGAKAGNSYLTKARDSILNIKAKDLNAYLKSRDNWHLNKVVYNLKESL